jgi:uncharacterized phage protein (TIGR02220 family)
MPRARNIKASFFSNDELGELDPLARLLFVGLWTLADYKGDLIWREKKVKAQLLPYDNCCVKKLAINLDKSGFIRFYSDGERIYLNIVNFTKHQNPHNNERKKGSDIPKINEDMRQVIDLKGITINRDKSGLNQEYSTSDRADSLILIPDPLSLIPEVPTVIPSQDVEIIVNHLNSKAGTKFKASTKATQSIINARLKTYSVADCMSVIETKCAEWKADSKMSMYLRPSTLFNETKFEGYLNQPVVNTEYSSITQQNINALAGLELD